jgi:hypothetical protein
MITAFAIHGFIVDDSSPVTPMVDCPHHVNGCETLSE